jgi:hypothetical protein
MHLYDDIFPVVKLDTQSLNYVMAMYATHLGTGNTLQGRVIGTGTISQYLRAGATFIQLFDEEPGRDALKEPGKTGTCSPVDKTIKELKRFEDIPNRREPYTLAMQKALVTEAACVDPDSMLAAMAEWFGTMLQAGGRRSEWAQERHHHNTKRKPQLNIRGEPAAFCLRDVEFLAAGKKKLELAAALANPHTVEHVELTFRTQKNNENGEKKVFSRNHKSVAFCVVTQWIRIVERFCRLVGAADLATTPLAVYYDKYTKTVRYITSDKIEQVMRRIACTVYNLDPVEHKAFLARFSPHSLRVGACCILQAMGFPDHEIQRLLRWKSAAWTVYTRNLVVITHKHNQAVTDASELPDFYV